MVSYHSSLRLAGPCHLLVLATAVHPLQQLLVFRRACVRGLSGEDAEGERRRNDETLRATRGVSHRIDHIHFNGLYQPMTSLTAISAGTTGSGSHTPEKVTKSANFGGAG